MATSITTTAINFSNGTSLSHASKPIGARMKHAEAFTEVNRTLTTTWTTHLSVTVELSKTQDVLCEAFFTALYGGSGLAYARVNVGSTNYQQFAIGQQFSDKSTGSHWLVARCNGITSGSKTFNLQVYGSSHITNLFGFSDYFKVIYIQENKT